MRKRADDLLRNNPVAVGLMDDPVLVIPRAPEGRRRQALGLRHRCALPGATGANTPPAVHCRVKRRTWNGGARPPPLLRGASPAMHPLRQRLRGECTGEAMFSGGMHC